MKIIECKAYLEQIKQLHDQFPYWNELEEKTLFISGATGMIGSFLVDCIMMYNEARPKEKRCTVIAVSRNSDAARKRFPLWFGRDEFSFVEQDISQPIQKLSKLPDYYIHAASTTHPLAYSTQPINSILANILGTKNILELASQKKNSRFLLLSSVEIYGENRGDTKYFSEDYCGYLNCNTLRAGYPEGKRASEALCQAFIRENDVSSVILRLPRTYGPTMRMSDTKAIAQFIKNGLRKENIVLKSQGSQLYSYAHTYDAVSGILYTLLRGEVGCAYNLGDSSSDISLKDLASLVAKYTKTEVIFDLPSELESKGYSTATLALMDAAKLRALGWVPRYDISEGILETLSILNEINTETNEE